MAPGLRAITLLALTAISLVGFAWQLDSETLAGFVHDNLMPYADRRHFLAVLATTGVGVAAVAAGYGAITSPRGLARLTTVSRLAAPLILITAVPSLLLVGKWEPLPTVIAIAAFTLVLERLLRLSFGELASLSFVAEGPLAGSSSRRARRWGLAVTLACAAVYAFYMSRYTLFSHRRFGTYGFDLGQYDNIFWTTLHGHPLRCTPLGVLQDWHELGNHADLSVFFLLPIYAIHPNAETLLVMQSSVLALGALPLYLFAARRLPAFYACAVSVCYLLYPPLHGANFYDFHFQPIASTFVLFTICFVDARRWVLTAIAYTIAIGCREDISVGLTILGLYLAFTGYRARAGIIMAAVGTVYFVVMRFVIMPRFGQGWFQEIFKDLYPMPDGPRTFGGVFETLVTNPIYVFHTLLTQEKLRYFLQIVTPVAMLPLRRGYLLPALIPGAFFTLLTTGYPPTVDIAFQYSGHFTPYLFCASALSLASFRTERRSGTNAKAGLAALVAGTILCTLQWGAFPPRTSIRGGFSVVNLTRPSAADEQRARDLAELNAMVPADAVVAVSEEEIPHVSGRLNILTLKNGPSGAEYLLYGPSSVGASSANSALATGEYVEVARRTAVILLKKKH